MIDIVSHTTGIFTLSWYGVIVAIDIRISDFSIVDYEYVAPNMVIYHVNTLPPSVYDFVHNTELLRQEWKAYLDECILCALDEQSAEKAQYQREMARWQQVHANTAAEIAGLKELRNAV